MGYTLRVFFCCSRNGLLRRVLDCERLSPLIQTSAFSSVSARFMGSTLLMSPYLVLPFSPCSQSLPWIASCLAGEMSGWYSLRLRLSLFFSSSTYR